jgi:uncharacterized protein
MMVIDITDILMEVGLAKDFEGYLSLEDFVYQGDNIHFEKPFYVEGTVVNGGEFVMLSAHVQGHAALQCGICTEPYDYTADNEIQINLKPIPDEDDPDIYVYSNNLIHLDDIIIREFILKLPVQRRCSVGCKGLCPYCGVNLNNEECQCTDEDRQPIDNRLRILKDFYANWDREV